MAMSGACGNGGGWLRWSNGNMAMMTFSGDGWLVTVVMILTSLAGSGSSGGRLVVVVTLMVVGDDGGGWWQW